MRKTFLFVLAIVLLSSVAAMAGRGEWYMNADESTGSLSTGSHVAYWNRDQGTLATREAGLQWTVLYGLDATTKCIDQTSTVGSGAGAYWNLNDNSTTQYPRLVIAPGNSCWDNSRGMVMAKIKVNSQGNNNGTFGFSTSTNGMLFCLRDSTINFKAANGDGITWTSPTVDVKSDYRVYAFAWSDNTVSSWYSNTNDWSGNSADWTPLLAGYTMAAGTNAIANGGGAYGGGIMLANLSSSIQTNDNIQWVAQTTYDSPSQTPWANDPHPTVPEPGSLLALASGLMGMAGLVLRKRA